MEIASIKLNFCLKMNDNLNKSYLRNQIIEMRKEMERQKEMENQKEMQRQKEIEEIREGFRYWQKEPKIKRPDTLFISPCLNWDGSLK